MRRTPHRPRRRPSRFATCTARTSCCCRSSHSDTSLRCICTRPSGRTLDRPRRRRRPSPVGRSWRSSGSRSRRRRRCRRSRSSPSYTTTGRTSSSSRCNPARPGRPYRRHPPCRSHCRRRPFRRTRCCRSNLGDTSWARRAPRPRRRRHRRPNRPDLHRPSSSSSSSPHRTPGARTRQSPRRSGSHPGC